MLAATVSNCVNPQIPLSCNPFNTLWIRPQPPKSHAAPRPNLNGVITTGFAVVILRQIGGAVFVVQIIDIVV